MLGKLLVATGEKPYLLRHGAGRHARHLILLRQSSELAQAVGTRPAPVRVSKYQFIPLPLAPGDEIGSVGKKLYDTDRGQWTATIAVARFR